MRIAKIAIALSLLAFWRNAPVRAQADDDNISVLLDQWQDPARDNRSIPVKIYYPQSGAPWPVIIVSHGLGGSRNGLRFEGAYWAAHGYVSIHLQHLGSDVSVLRNAGGSMRAAMADAFNPQQLQNRCDDVKFALDHLTAIQNDPSSPLAGKLNLDEIAMAGHSFGAITTEFMCGETFPTPAGEKSFFDPRIKAGIAFSPSPPRAGDPKAAFSKVSIPMFFWTGTDDTVPGGDSPPQRRIPFDSINGNDEYLAILTGADHMIFNGRLVEDAQLHPNDAQWKSLIQRGTTAFLDAYLRHDAQALHFLKDGPFAAEIQAYGTFEEKLQAGK